MENIVDGRTFIYRIDAKNTITFLNREWIDFAMENEAPELSPDYVLGQDPDRFIADWETRHLYALIYDRVRRSGREICFPFRCDSPSRRRFFQMRIAPLPKGGLEFTAEVLRIEERHPIPLLDNSAEHSSSFVVICSWCKRIEMDEESWVEIEDATEREELFGATPPSLTHDICPNCLRTIRRQFEDS